MIKIKLNIEKNGEIKEKEMILFDIEAKAEELMNFKREKFERGGSEAS